MVGFLLKSKAKGIAKPEVSKPKMGFSLGRKPQSSSTGPVKIKDQKRKVKGFDNDSDNEEDKVISIDSFDQQKGGAISQNNAINVKKVEPPLVIKPTKLNKEIRHSTYVPNMEHRQPIALPDSRDALHYGLNEIPKQGDTENEIVNEENEEENMDSTEKARELLLSGKNITQESSMVIEASNEPDTFGDVSSDEDFDQYDEVPVEKFGAALLRGMGWKGDDRKQAKSSIDIDKRQKGALVGIGAQRVESELIDDLMGKNKKINIPVKRVDRQNND